LVNTTGNEIRESSRCGRGVHPEWISTSITVASNNDGIGIGHGNYESENDQRGHNDKSGYSIHGLSPLHTSAAAKIIWLM
jgi:hypothetical protein